LHGLFERCEIELVEEIDPACGEPEDRARAEKRSRRKARWISTGGRPMRCSCSSRHGKVRLLTAQEEVDLAKRIWRGDLDAKAEDGRVQPAPRRLDRQELRNQACRSST